VVSDRSGIGRPLREGSEGVFIAAALAVVVVLIVFVRVGGFEVYGGKVAMVVVEWMEAVSSSPPSFGSVGAR
jgi:hypothetical protein